MTQDTESGDCFGCATETFDSLDAAKAFAESRIHAFAGPYDGLWIESDDPSKTLVIYKESQA